MNILSKESITMCTRVVYKGPNNTNITARSMDFAMEIPANLWVLPRGMERVSRVKNNTLTWVSKYGSLVTSSYDIAVSDGMNEKGLVANLLWLTSTQYPQVQHDVEGNSLLVVLDSVRFLMEFLLKAIQTFRRHDGEQYLTKRI